MQMMASNASALILVLLASRNLLGSKSSLYAKLQESNVM